MDALFWHFDRSSQHHVGQHGARGCVADRVPVICLVPQLVGGLRYMPTLGCGVACGSTRSMLNNTLLWLTSLDPVHSTGNTLLPTRERVGHRSAALGLGSVHDWEGSRLTLIGSFFRRWGYAQQLRVA